MAEDSDRERLGQPGSLVQAKDRFRYELEVQGYARANWLKDLKFARADSYNTYQWPREVLDSREHRPSLTINKTRVHNLLIVNGIKKNRPQVKFRSMGGEATDEAAQALNGFFRQLEARSRADEVYSTAIEYQVDAGIGYIRVGTDWVDEKSTDQEILLLPVDSPLGVLLDSDAKRRDKSDARYCFIFEDARNDQLDIKYPQLKGVRFGQAALDIDNGWLTKDHTRVAEYFWIEETVDQLLVMEGQPIPVYRSQFQGGGELWNEMVGKEGSRTRRVVRRTCKWRLIAGGQFHGKAETIPGEFIPIIPVIGEESVIENRLDRKGHTRALLDAQKMYNYWSSAAVEYGALQTKIPWVAAAAAIEGHEESWNNANTKNLSVLPYNAWDDEGQALPAPQRPPPPEQAPLYISGMQLTQQEMMLVSGQWQAQQGQQGNERSAAAIQERAQQGETATFHFEANFATALRQVGRVVLSMLSVVYDTRRFMAILAEDGKSLSMVLDPGAAQAYAQRIGHTGEVVERILNPTLGKYDVSADVGPDYATNQAETFAALSQLIAQAPQLIPIVGDLLVKAGGFPMADEAAQRLRRTVDPAILGQGPSQQEKALGQQLAQANQVILQLYDTLKKERLEVKGKDSIRVIDAFDAETRRMAALSKILPPNPTELRKLAEQLEADMAATSLAPVTQNAEQSLAAAEGPPVPGARQAPDGNWYLPDPNRPGKYVRIENVGQPSGESGPAPNTEPADSAGPQPAGPGGS